MFISAVCACYSKEHVILTHYHLDKMADILHMRFQNPFLSNKSFYILTQSSMNIIHYGQNWYKASICLGNGLAPYRRQAITGADADLIHRRIHVSPGDKELTNSLNIPFSLS